MLDAEELEALIKDTEEKLKVLRHELDVKILSTQASSVLEMITGPNAADKAALAAKREQIADGVQTVSKARKDLSALRQADAERAHQEHVLTLNPFELEHSLRHARLELKAAKRERGAANYLLFRRKSREQARAIESLEEKIENLSYDLELIRTHRQTGSSGKSKPDSNGDGSGRKIASMYGSDHAEHHIAGDVQVCRMLVESPASSCRMFACARKTMFAAFGPETQHTHTHKHKHTAIDLAA